MADALFEEPRLAALYDVLEADRSDLDVYAAIVTEFEARTVLDIGCGTGTFALLLARAGVDLIGVDPALASLDVARRKPDAARVRWVHGDATAVGDVQVDLVTMTGNVAQVFTTDHAWSATLAAIQRSLRPSGRFVFESRDPRRQAWLEWTADRTRRKVPLPDGGSVETWFDLLDVQGELVTFRATYVFDDGQVLESESTLRFRALDELAGTLDDRGFVVRDVRDAPDRPGRELVLIAQTREG
jgi:SAM-dependent methyltransferase